MEKEVMEQVREYFKEHLPQYEVLEVRKKSNHSDDWFLWMVSAKHRENDTYAFWSSYNTETGSLNHGHYGLANESDCHDLFEEFYYKGE